SPKTFFLPNTTPVPMALQCDRGLSQPVAALLDLTQRLFEAVRLGDAHADQDTQETLNFSSCGFVPANQARILLHNPLDHDTHAAPNPVFDPEFRVARMARKPGFSRRHDQRQMGGL